MDSLSVTMDVGPLVGGEVDGGEVMGLAEGDFVDAFVGLEDGLAVLGEVEGALELWLVVDEVVGDGVLDAIGLEVSMTGASKELDDTLACRSESSPVKRAFS